jgi:hypothetical protein
MKQLMLGVLAALALTGCPDPGGGGGNDPAALVGTWTEVAEPGETGEVITFRADGTYDLDSSEGDQSGTYVANSQTLTLDDSSGRDEMPYVLDGDRMLGIGLQRDAGTAGIGFIGEWHADGLEDGVAQSIDLSIRADMTAQLEVPDDSGPLQITGTWRTDSAGIVTTLSIGGQTLDITWHSLRGSIGAPLYRRN